MRTSVAPLVIAVTAVVVSALTRGERDRAPSPAPAVTASPSSEVRAAPAPALGAVEHLAVDHGAPASRDHARELQLPDGTFVPALNSAVDPAPLQDFWGPFPWSAIVAVERSSAGVDWYRHADGSYSTTQMVWRADLGREVAMTRVAHPGPADVPAAGGAATAVRSR